MLTPQQIKEWMAYYAIDPWGEQRADLRNAILGSLLGAAHGKRIPLAQLMPYNEETAQQSQQKKQAESVRSLRTFLEQRAIDGAPAKAPPK